MSATKGLYRSGRGVGRMLAVSALLVAMAGLVAGGPAEAAPKNPPGDPPGNNGTVKIERDGPADEDKGNEPIGDGCIIWLEFYGFDQGQTADISFTAQMPSGTGELLADKAVAISDDAAGGGQDRDAVIGYNLTSAVAGLKVHKQHGYHIKLRSDSLEAPGGAKQKVFWIKCAPAQATTLRVAKATQGPGAGPFAFEVNCTHRPLNTTFNLEPGGKQDITSVPAGTVCAVTETDNKGATGTTITENPSDGTADGKITLAAGTPGIVTFTNTFPGDGGTGAPDNTDIPAPPPAPAPPQEVTDEPGGASGDTPTPGTPAPANPDTAVLGETLTNTAPLPAGSTLPRTGADPSSLLSTGLWSLSAGALALAAGRARRRR
jgi:hypothetical protein